MLTVSVGGDTAVNKEDVLTITISTAGTTNTGFYIDATESLNFATIYAGTGSLADSAIDPDQDVAFTWNGQTTTSPRPRTAPPSLSAASTSS